MNINEYESVIIVNPDIEEEKKIELIGNIQKIINNDNGIITKIDELGIKNLAYEIKQHKKGYYIVIYFKSSFEVISKLEKFYKQDENVMKFIVVKMSE